MSFLGDGGHQEKMFLEMFTLLEYVSKYLTYYRKEIMPEPSMDLNPFCTPKRNNSLDGIMEEQSVDGLIC